MKNQKIKIVGAGAIGTALGNILAEKGTDVELITIEADVAESINAENTNHKYFPNIHLHKSLKANLNTQVLTEATVIFMAIPSNVTVEYVLDHQSMIQTETIIVNMAKGFSNERRTITESLSKHITNPVCAFKGPTFARELINRLPTGFTVGIKEKKHFNEFEKMFRNTPVHVDYSSDVKGVELLSILKNIYAIAMGIVDAHFNSPNLRFLFLTKAFNEMRDILMEYGGKQKTMFKYCGYGDFTLTALNDLSRNRTLGLLIGKGFFTDNLSNKLVLEGKNAVNVFCNEISQRKKINGHYHIISELHKVFNEDYSTSSFVKRVLE